MRHRAGCQDKPSQYRRVDKSHSPIHHSLNSLYVTKTIKTHTFKLTITNLHDAHPLSAVVTPELWQRPRVTCHASRVTRPLWPAVCCARCLATLASCPRRTLIATTILEHSCPDCCCSSGEYPHPLSSPQPSCHVVCGPCNFAKLKKNKITFFCI